MHAISRHDFLRNSESEEQHQKIASEEEQQAHSQKRGPIDHIRAIAKEMKVFSGQPNSPFISKT